MTDRFNDAIFSCGICCGGKVLITADGLPESFSPQMAERFAAAPNTFILKMFRAQGGGSLQICGEPKPWLNSMLENPDLRCIHFDNLPCEQLTKQYSLMKEHKKAIVGWGKTLNYEAVYRAVGLADHQKTAKTGITLMCQAKSCDHGLEIIEKHKKESRNFRQ